MTLMDPETSRRLVSRLREEDPQAFAEAHEMFHGRLYGFLARLARSRDVAEDLLEETGCGLCDTRARSIQTPSLVRGCLPSPGICTSATADRARSRPDISMT